MRYKNEEELLIQTSRLNLIITPNHVKEALLKWSSGLIPADVLVDWARFILMAGCFETPEKDNFFFYDDLWTILGEISSPDTDGKLTAKRVNEYLQVLSKICV